MSSQWIHSNAALSLADGFQEISLLHSKSVYLSAPKCIFSFLTADKMLQAHRADNQSCIILPGKFFFSLGIWLTVRWKGSVLGVAFSQVAHVVIISSPAQIRGTGVRPILGNVNSLSEQPRLGYCSKDSTAERKKWFCNWGAFWRNGFH